MSARPALATGSAPAPIACPACGAPVAADQSWCLECGGAARTRIARLPRWRAATLAVAVAVLLALGALVYAFVELSSGSGTVTTTPTITQPAPAAAGPTATTVPPAVGATGASGAATPSR